MMTSEDAMLDGAGALVPLRVGLLTPSGWGNLGDAAIQDAMIQAIRRRDPGARIEAFTLNPADTRRRHGVEADVLSGFGLMPGYRVAKEGAGPSEAPALAPDLSSSAGGTTSSSPSSAPVEPDAPSPSSSLPDRGWIRRSVALADEMLYRVLCDARYLRRLRRKLKDFDLVLVSGGGQVDAEWGGAFGHPWTLAKWSLLCRSMGVPFSLLGVGVHHLDSTISRLFARIALANAHLVTFRDEASLRHAQRLRLVKAAAIVPDLAFAHEELDPAAWAPGEKGTVAVGPISWCDPRVWPRRDGRAYRGYLEKLAVFVRLLLEEGRRVILVPGDGTDNWAIEDLAGILGGKNSSAGGVLEIPRIESVAGLVDSLRHAEVVVTSRLHGVLLSAALGKPVLAVVYDRKVDTLARDLHLEDYAVDIERFDVLSLRAKFERLEMDGPGIRENLSPVVLGYRRRLEELFEEVL